MHNEAALQVLGDLPLVPKQPQICYNRGIYSSIILLRGVGGIKPEHLGKMGKKTGTFGYFSHFHMKVGKFYIFKDIISPKMQ